MMSAHLFAKYTPAGCAFVGTLRILKAAAPFFCGSVVSWFSWAVFLIAFPRLYTPRPAR